MKYCIHCGTQINDEDVFCTTCGKKVSGAAAEPEAAVGPEPVRETESVQKPEPAVEPERLREEPAPESGFNAGRFFKTLILVILPIISAAMLFMNWTVFKGDSSAQVGSIISTCAGYTDNGVVNAMGDGGIAPSEFAGMADSVDEIARFLAYSGNASSVELVADVFRVLELVSFLVIGSAVVVIIFRAVRPLRKARNLDFGFFFLQIILFVSMLLISIRMNSYIKANAANTGIFGAGFDLKMSMTVWSIIALICSIPACIIDLIRFPGERKEKPAKRSALPVITGIGSVLLAGGIVFAALYILTASSYGNEPQASEPQTPYEIIYPETQTAGETETTAQITAETTESTIAAETQTEPAKTGESTVPETAMETSAAGSPEPTAAPVMEINSTIGSHLKEAARAFPETMEQYIYAYTDRTLETVDDGSYIDCYADDLLIMDMSGDGSALEIKYPAGDGYKVKWFDREDILGVCDQYPETYTANRDALTYVYSDAYTLKADGFIKSGDTCIVLGRREIDDTTYELTIYPIEDSTVNEVDGITYRIALIEQDSRK